MASGTPAILDASGQPIKRRANVSDTPYRAAGYHPDLATFNPPRVSEDGAVLRGREKMAARTHDLVRNDGWAATAVNRWVNGIIGKGWKVQARPDWRALGLSRDWAAEFGKALEAHWRTFATDQRFNCDWQRYNNIAGLFRLFARHWATDNESLGVLRWREDRGLAPYHTAIEVLDPARLSTPYGRYDDDLLRDGVELDPVTREPVGYHIRRGHPGDRLSRIPHGFEWVRLPRETGWGRPVVIHAFERARAGSTRPASRFAPIVQKLKQLTRYDETEVQAALINAIFAAYIRTPLDAESFATAFGGGHASGGQLDKYVAAQVDYHEAADIRLNGARLNHLFPGEDLVFPAASHPNTVFAEFEDQALRYISSALDLSYEQLSNNWSKTNYSSARAALLEVRLGLDCAKEKLESGIANPIYSALVEELIETGRVDLPSGAPSFAEGRAAYCAAGWIGAGRGWVDPVKEAQGAALRIETGLSTLQAECAELGLDWEEVITQRSRELAMFKELNVPAPSVMGVLANVMQKDLMNADE